MERQEPNPASAKEQAEGSRENVNVAANKAAPDSDDHFKKTGLEGKTDSGPEPDVFGREIPPQE